VNDAELVDDEQLIFALLRRDLASSVGVAAELDVDSIDSLPFVTFIVTGGDQGANGPGLWAASLALNVFAQGQDEAWVTARAVYGAVHKWDTPGASILDAAPELGYVSRVTDLNKFSRVGSVEMQGKNITQYLGTFELKIRN
jgi:hypothetical protein